MSTETQIDFSAILASSIHDMKNSLGMVLSSLEEIVEGCEGAESCSVGGEQISRLQYESKRVSDNLIQLLTIYKLESDKFSPNISEYEVADFLEECYLRDKPLLDFRGIEAEVSGGDFLSWYFDRELIAGVVDNVVTNALRYTKDRLALSAEEEDGWLVIRIDDNGSGFPPHMLTANLEEQQGVEFGSGRTGLGLYFSTLVAGLHRNGERRGRVEITNGGSLGGGCFTIYIP